MARRKDGVRVTAQTEAMMTIAAQALGTTVAEMTERACVGLLKHETRQLFERELAQAEREAAARNQPSVQRHEFAATWKPPAWKP
jgi:hypothetical protein